MTLEVEYERRRHLCSDPPWRDNDGLRAIMRGVSEVQRSVYLLEDRTSAHVELKQRRSWWEHDEQPSICVHGS